MTHVRETISLFCDYIRKELGCADCRKTDVELVKVDLYHPVCHECSNEYHRCDRCNRYVTTLKPCGGFKVCRKQLCIYCGCYCHDCLLITHTGFSSLESLFKYQHRDPSECYYHSDTGEEYGCSVCVQELLPNPTIEDYFMQRMQADRKEAMLQEIKYAPIPAQVKRKKILVADIECGLLNGAGYLSAKEHFKSNAKEHLQN